MNLDQINDLHEQAMTLAEAAARIASRVDEEPMRSVLHRSAASLALNCEEYRLAEKPASSRLGG
jgi:hypothetical protein